MKKTLFLLFLSFLSVFTFSESKMILIPTGKFTMGSPENEFGRVDGDNETQHKVNITKPKTKEDIFARKVYFMIVLTFLVLSFSS